MSKAELTSLTLTEQSALLRSRQVSAVELTTAHLDRIEAVNPKLNAYMLVMADQALAEAHHADAVAARGGWLGLLHGIPVGIKDLYDVAGVPNTFGSRILQQKVPQSDSTVVRRLRAAGAVILGKQGLHEFAYGATSENPHYGAVHNPRDRERITGGSSGGTAAAVAAGLCAVGMGSDTGGSIRIPSALCGIAGLKPTFGRVSRHGTLPLAWSLDHMGPMARSVADLAVTLQAIAGPDPLDPATADEPVPDYSRDLQLGVRGLRLGVPREYFWETIDPDVATAVSAAIQVMGELGAEVQEVSLPSLLHAGAANTVIIGSEALSWHEEWLRSRPQDYGADVYQRLLTGVTNSAIDYLKAQRIRSVIQAEFAEVLTRVDALLTPTMVLVAPKIGETFAVDPVLGVAPRTVLTRNTLPGNLTGLPAVTVPCGSVRRLPVGLQVIGAAWQEALLLRIARAFEEANPFPIPLLQAE